MSLTNQPVEQQPVADTGDGLRVVLQDGSDFGQPGETVVLSHSVARAAIASGHAIVAGPVSPEPFVPLADATEGPR